MIPRFTYNRTTEKEHITRHAAAAMLDVNYDSLRMLIDTGVLTEPLRTDAVEALAQRPWLSTIEGEMTVLRTGVCAAVDDDDRDFMGFTIDFKDPQLEAAVLRWWRSDPTRIVGNKLFTVTVRTIPVALYAITRCVNEADPDIDGKGHRRFWYEGTLLARIDRRDNEVDGWAPLSGNTREDFVIRTSQNRWSPYMEAITQIMHSRIVVASGGPIGYLSAG